ncbi:uncharacterized protein CELE_C49F8.14 [Caenorhabditis elegans]|uniref:Uncharacterized protein n=1 Tax=Caenorhabditis elegans TaxID=6239 RepID=A0A2K5AU14_CAEEL|nr:Uncharacterized protein CELE_C49F8.14 [Caenorhabditis elegans]SPC48661.1 Uncharacterized protein CELE_C49F8.14 [Caenorhabditis elegans]|eukprot:NP_001348800.1 Uncharacterized protein CELE_C49F8.14 [Caenorhabditis elegans]
MVDPYWMANFNC